MKILVVGSRNFNNYELLKNTIDATAEVYDDIEIVSGGAKGADSLAEQYAKEKGYALKIFPADWNKYGKSAGYRRNAEMHKYISEFKDRLCVAFWDGQSKGTQHNFELAAQYKNPIILVKYQSDINVKATLVEDELWLTENQSNYLWAGNGVLPKITF